MYDIFLFDLDGTLTDPKLGITSCVQYALSFFDIHEPDRDKLIPFIGPPLKTSFMELYSMSEEDADEAVRRYRERFSTVGMYENKVFRGTHELLKALKAKGKKLAIATSKPIEFTEKILAHFQLQEYFDEVVGARLGGKSLGEKSEIIAETISRFGEDKKSQMIMIGDRKMDISGAKENGIASVGVRFGYAEAGELEQAGADYIADTMDKLKELLLSM